MHTLLKCFLFYLSAMCQLYSQSTDTAENIKNTQDSTANESAQENSVKDQPITNKPTAQKSQAKTNLGRFFNRRYKNLQKLTNDAAHQSSEMAGYLENNSLDENKKIMHVPSERSEAFRQGGALAMAASTPEDLKYLESGQALLKLANGVISKKICEKACTRKGCQTPRLRALCQAKCGQNKKARLRCSQANFK